jgi:hypothetical protein
MKARPFVIIQYESAVEIVATTACEGTCVPPASIGVGAADSPIEPIDPA